MVLQGMIVVTLVGHSVLICFASKDLCESCWNVVVCWSQLPLTVSHPIILGSVGGKSGLCISICTLYIYIYIHKMVEPRLSFILD